MNFTGWVILLSLCLIQHTSGFSLSTQPVSKLVNVYADEIASLKAEATNIVGSIEDESYANDAFFLRFCLSEDPLSLLKQNLEWRKGDGKKICEAAQTAIAEALAGGKWDNEPVRAAAPYASIINKYITPSQALTTTTNKGDLVYCIRAGKIDDTELMSRIGDPSKLVDFFLYCKEINSAVANLKSPEQDRLVCIVTANDLVGVKLVGGSKDFRTALSEASKKSVELYPNIAGPTLLLNLPKLLGAIVKLFTPLFPSEVRKKLKFERGPLKDVESMMEVTSGSGRQEFLSALDDLIYSDN